MKKLALFLLAALLIVSCGSSGGGGGGGDSKHQPSISNLEYSPTSANQGDGGGMVTVDGTFDFIDKGGDVKKLTLIGYDSGMNETDRITIDITGASGITQGTIFIQAFVETNIAGTFYFTVHVTDSKGKSSNALMGTFVVN
jgi:hypothetical protein